MSEIGYTGGISIEHEPEHYNPFPEVEASRQILIGLLEKQESNVS
jgi:hypothetical protein